MALVKHGQSFKTMAITINGNGTVTGISVGGLPDGIVDRDTLATQAKGSILQVKQTVKTDTSSTDNVNSFEDISGMSVAITPSSTSSKILVMVDMRLSTNTNRNINLTR